MQKTLEKLPFVGGKTSSTWNETGTATGTATATANTTEHPIGPLTADEISRSSKLVKASWPEGTEYAFKVITLLEPKKEELLPHFQAERKGEVVGNIERRTFVVYDIKNTVSTSQFGASLKQIAAGIWLTGCSTGQASRSYHQSFHEQSRKQCPSRAQHPQQRRRRRNHSRRKDRSRRSRRASRARQTPTPKRHSNHIRPLDLRLRRRQRRPLRRQLKDVSMLPLLPRSEQCKRGRFKSLCASAPNFAGDLGEDYEGYAD